MGNPSLRIREKLLLHIRREGPKGAREANACRLRVPFDGGMARASLVLRLASGIAIQNSMRQPGDQQSKAKCSHPCQVAAMASNLVEMKALQREQALLVRGRLQVLSNVV